VSRLCLQTTDAPTTEAQTLQESPKFSVDEACFPESDYGYVRALAFEKVSSRALGENFPDAGCEYKVDLGWEWLRPEAEEGWKNLLAHLLSSENRDIAQTTDQKIK